MTQSTQISQEEINAILWKACDTFRGTIDPSEYKNYILVMLFVKYISDVWQDHYDALKHQHGDDEALIRFKLRHERFVLPPGCRFEDLYAQRNEPNLGEVINKALEEIEDKNKEKLEGVFRNIDFNSEAALGRTRQRNERLQNLLNDFADPRLDLRPSRVGDLDIIGNADGVEILIVVDKLLTGFDEPRNTVLYVDKPLKEHSLLQAIARVNRLFEGKPFGYIIDYRGVLGELNEAMETYTALEAFDPEDVRDTFTDVSAAVAKLPQYHADLWAVFKTVPNKRDIEALQQFLAPEDRRQRFYEALTAFAGCLKVALSTVAFHNDVPPGQIRTYKDDLRYFHRLRTAVKQRYAEAIDHKAYEAKIRKLMDDHIKADDVQPLTELVNIFNAEQFDAEVARVTGVEARADTIAHRVKQTATEYMDQDPAFYKKFSQFIDETITAYRQGRITEADYLAQVSQARDHMRQGRVDDRPDRLKRYKHAPAYFGLIQEPVGQYAVTAPVDNMAELMAEMTIKVEEIIEAQKVRDWTRNEDVQKRIKAAIEDHLFMIKGRYDIPLTLADIDQLSDSLVEVAKQREHQ